MADTITLSVDSNEPALGLGAPVVQRERRLLGVDSEPLREVDVVTAERRTSLVARDGQRAHAATAGDQWEAHRRAEAVHVGDRFVGSVS